jgi:hypothetical protein
MIYIRADRKILAAETWKGMVRILHVLSFDTAQNKKEYMFNVARRVQQLYEQYIENYRYEGFVRALSKLGIITVLKCADCDNFCMSANTNSYYCSRGIKKYFRPSNVECSFITNKLIRKL